MIPADVSLQYFGMREAGNFELQGIAINDQDVSFLQSALVVSPLFKNVDLQYATKRKRFSSQYLVNKIA